jgi:hypothetical protein
LQARLVQHVGGPAVARQHSHPGGAQRGHRAMVLIELDHRHAVAGLAQAEGQP